VGVLCWIRGPRDCANFGRQGIMARVSKKQNWCQCEIDGFWVEQIAKMVFEPDFELRSFVCVG